MVKKPATEMAASLAAISQMSRTDLAKLWAKSIGQSLPAGLSRRLLEYAVAYHLQAKALGGLSSSSKRLLNQAAQLHQTSEQRQPKQHSAKRIGPGARIVREWHGRTYTVDVLEKGYLHEGRTYRSLSEIARAITGARWSGPRFFSA